MKKLVLALTLAMLVMLPLLGLAQETPATTQPFPAFGRGRWAQDGQAPLNNYSDENEDGICDACGQVPGQNPNAPGFVDEDQDGVCDYLGTRQQFQGRMQGMRGRMMRRGMTGQGFTDENQDGVCDACGAQPSQGRMGQRGPRMRHNRPGMQNRMPGRFGR